MHPKIKRLPTATPTTVRTVKPLVLHDVTNGPAGSSRRPFVGAMQTDAAPAKHPRPHGAPRSQA